MAPLPIELRIGEKRMEASVSKRSWVWSAALVVVAWCLTAGVSSVASAATGVVRVPAAAFHVNESRVRKSWTIGAFVSGQGHFVAPVEGLPPDATITNVSLYALDSSATGDASLSLFKTQFGHDFTWSLGQVYTSGSGKHVREFSKTDFDNATIDADQNLSLLLVIPIEGNNGAIQVQGVEIEYSTP